MVQEWKEMRLSEKFFWESLNEYLSGFSENEKYNSIG